MGSVTVFSVGCAGLVQAAMLADRCHLVCCIKMDKIKLKIYGQRDYLR